MHAFHSSRRVASQLTGFVLALSFIVTVSADETDLKQFFANHCVKCHGSKTQEADRRMDDLSFDLSDDTTLGNWQDILDQLNLGDMPPPTEARPDGEKLKRAIAEITHRIQKSQTTKGNRTTETVLRRLNRREYLNTIRDLFGFDMTMFDPTIGFPDDSIQDGFDNQGEALVTSSYLLENYLDAAEIIIDKAIITGPRPEPKLIRMRPPFDRTTNAHSGWVTQERRETREFQSIFQGTKERFGYRPLDDIAAGVPHDGYYNVRVKACGLHRQHDYPIDLIGTDVEEPIRLALVSGSQAFGTLHLRQSIEKTLATFDLPDNEPRWMETRIWLDKGFQPRMTYQNGPYFFKVLPNILNKRFPGKFPIKLVYSNWWKVCQNIKTPQVRVHEVEVEGPFYDQWPPQGHIAIFGDRPFSRDRIPKIVEQFASRAFRRPVKPQELDSLLRLIHLQRESGDSDLDALKSGLAAVLCSPGFLYLEESTKPETNLLDDFAIASRLSYFLWSTSPDQELLDLAATGKLSDAGLLTNQAERMLEDPRADALANDFPDHWLTLHKLGEMPPDSNSFKHYYVGELESAMRRETQLFFQHLLSKNLDIANFLDSDFTFVNRPLAHHYKIDIDKYDQLVSRQKPNDGFVKIQLDDAKRGGVFGQASVLTVTANGIDTSPVIRGVWVLENILGASTPPPPEGVEPLEPDTRGSVSIRDQLKKHRDVATCAQCHRKIDPIGFALESFDAIGGIRSHYVSRKTRLKIDTSGKLPDGQSFKDIVDVKAILMTRKSQFARCLTEKVISYSIGRPLTVRDRPDIDQIVESLTSNGSGLKDLVLSVVGSDTFRSR